MMSQVMQHGHRPSSSCGSSRAFRRKTDELRHPALRYLGIILLVAVFLFGIRSTAPGAGCRSASRVQPPKS